MRIQEIKIEDDGDVRPAALFRLPRPKAARLAWRPWLRSFALGALIGALMASIAWLLVLSGIEQELRPSWSRKDVR